MLTHLLVTNFTLVEHQELQLRAGLTVLTGETGAGKSILLDALGLALGDRADATKVRAGAQQAEVCASFDVTELPRVQRWLLDADLGADECIMRRIVTKEGRSRALINGRPVTQAQLKALAARLLDMHSQHEHQSLMNTQHHRGLLDDYGQLGRLGDEVKLTYQRLADIDKRLDHVQRHADEINARYQLLSYQAQELETLALGDDELASLEQQQRKLANAELIQQTCQQSAEACIGMEHSIGAQLHRVVALLSKLPHLSERMAAAKSMLQEARIQVEEAGRELALEAEDDSGGYDLPQIEARLSAIYEVARKHRVAPEDLAELHNTVTAELRQLQSSDAELQALANAKAEALTVYHATAVKLSQARTKAAKKLAREVNQHLRSLAMPHAELALQLTPLAEPCAAGAESVEFLLSTVPGQAPQPLVKIASGGELSRVSLAIAVVTAKTAVTPTLIFDEVDVGIGGATGDVVGRMLRELGQSAQVLCVTHLAQVASKARHHYTVEKVVHKQGAATLIRELDADDRVLEVARMMGGAIDSEQSLAHAREMLSVE